MKTLRILLISLVLIAFSSAGFAQAQMQDVVYLKNGSIIRGMIIEQVPNKTLKIETKDGSIFVYTFDEIEKITKEPARSARQPSESQVLFGVRASAGMDVSNGATGVGGAISIIYTPSSSALHYEFGVDFFTSKFIENKTELGSVSDVTELLLFTARTNFLFNYHPDANGVFYMVGFGVVGGIIDWERIDGLNGTGNIIEEDNFSPIGNIVNVGIGLSTRIGLEPRLEIPLIFFYNAGNTSAFLPTVAVSLGYRF